jgi:hypothetical protein
MLLPRWTALTLTTSETAMRDEGNDPNEVKRCVEFGVSLGYRIYALGSLEGNWKGSSRSWRSNRPRYVRRVVLRVGVVLGR